MFKRLLVAALLLSVLGCAAWDLLAQRRQQEERALEAQKRRDLHALHDIDQEVRVYQKKRDALQARIDVINQLKQNQKTAAEAVAKLTAADDPSIESAAVVDGRSLLVNTPSGSRTLR